MVRWVMAARGNEVHFRRTTCSSLIVLARMPLSLSHVFGAIKNIMRWVCIASTRGHEEDSEGLLDDLFANAFLIIQKN